MLRVTARGEAAEILLYGPIGSNLFEDGITAKDFRDAVKANANKPLTVRVNSPGGSVFEASAMLQALDEHTKPVSAVVDGVAASAATMILMGAKKIKVASNALLMIHEAQILTSGRASELRTMADALDKMNEQLVASYRRRSPLSEADLKEKMAAETWMSGQEAVAFGFADEVTDAVSASAFADLLGMAKKLGYKHLPEIPKAETKTAPTRSSGSDLAAAIDHALLERGIDADLVARRIRLDRLKKLRP
jgi:ATP-dependent protease ClpP protease subunit